MEKKIFEDFGCKILSRDGKYFICYDSGESAGSKMLEDQITYEEVEKAQLSEKDAYEVILSVQNRKNASCHVQPSEVSKNNGL